MKQHQLTWGKDIFRTLQQPKAENTFFSTPNGSLTKLEHILD
jgi:hypothetical protein